MIITKTTIIKTETVADITEIIESVLVAVVPALVGLFDGDTVYGILDVESVLVIVVPVLFDGDTT